MKIASANLGSRSIRWVGLLLALSSGSCSDGGNLLMPPDRPAYSEIVEWYDVSGGSDQAHKEDVSGSFPEWRGEDPTYQSLDGAVYACPAISTGVVMLDTTTDTYIIAGVLVKVYDLPKGPKYPRARYRVPDTEHYNWARNRYIFGGYLDVDCIGWYVTLGPVRLWVGYLEPFGYSGTSGVSNKAPATAGGWAYKDSNTTNGNSTDPEASWQQALDSYLTSGTCTPGWDIWVDGTQVCAAG